MKTTWEEFDDNERVIRACALASGIPPIRARQLSERLACHPLNQKRARKIAAVLAIRTLRQPPSERRQHILRTLGAFLKGATHVNE